MNKHQVRLLILEIRALAGVKASQKSGERSSCRWVVTSEQTSIEMSAA